MKNHLNPIQAVDLFVSSTSTENGMDQPDNANENDSSSGQTSIRPDVPRRFELIILKLLMLPLRLLIVKPIRMLMEAFIDSLADDNTEDVEAPVGESSITTMTLDAPSLTKALTTTTSSHALIDSKPVGDRWAISDDKVDLTGNWELLATDDFRKEYDRYLEQLGQPKLVRSVALGIVGQTTEQLRQSDKGRSLLIVGRNIRGVWSRTLVASGTDFDNDEFVPLFVPITSADSEQVEAESWWENCGTVHVSWMRGVTKYGGGSFESRRYLVDNNTVYVCESSFFPNDPSKEPIQITWRFQRQPSNSLIETK
jgi:hypothetical protein